MRPEATPALAWDIAAGAIGGLAWTAALRAVMAAVAAAQSQVHWLGTFGMILLPGTLAGALLGWAFARRRRGLGRGATWLALAPLAAGLDPFAIALPAAIIGLGFACSGRGSTGIRLVAGVPSALLLLVVPFVPAMLNSDLVITTPRGAWISTLIASLLAIGVMVETRLLSVRPVADPIALGTPNQPPTPDDPTDDQDPVGAR